MLTATVIGVGNAGSQVAAKAKEVIGEIDCIAMNCSGKDLETIPNSVYKVSVAKPGMDTKGSGKDRDDAKDSFGSIVTQFIKNPDVDVMMQKDLVFVVSSTGGGTGSGISVALANILMRTYLSTQVILVGILPMVREGLSTQTNTLEWLNEVYNVSKNITYMLYDNEALATENTPDMMNHVNEAIVSDFRVFMGEYQTTTKYSSMDERDMLKVLGTPKRIAVAKALDIKEKDLDNISLEDLLIEDFKHNAHAELQLDHIVMKTGLICNLSDPLIRGFNTQIPKVVEYLGSPAEEFEHVSVNEDRHFPNNLILIASGLTQVNDRIRKINERIEDINEKRAQMEEADELNEYDSEEFNKMLNRNEKSKSNEAFTVEDVMAQFGVKM